MSWMVYLEGPDSESCPVDRHWEGGTYAIGGIDTADLNVTYNYGGSFRKSWPEPLPDSDCLFAMLNGRTAGETIPSLETAVAKLGTNRSADYWEQTDGNAGAALNQLLQWARQHPNARWRVS